MKNLLSATALFAGRIEKVFCYGSLLLMAILPALESLLRPFSISIPYSRVILMHLFLLTGLFATMLTTQAKEHITIAVIQYTKSQKLKNILAFITGLVAAVVAVNLFWNSFSFLMTNPPGRTVAFIPEDVFIMCISVAFGVIALRFAIQSSHTIINREAEGGKSLLYKILPWLAILFGCVISLPAISKIIWGFDAPEPFYTWVNLLYDATLYARLPLIILFITAAFSGAPIFVAIGGIALVILQAAGREPEDVPIQIYTALTDPDIIAIPLFTLTGFFLSESKSGERLVAAFKSLFNRIRGGMIIATVVICAFFTSFTGASGVTILALGGILYIILKEKSGYSEKVTLGLLTSVGGIGELFPPSLPIILVGTTINSILFFMGEPVNYNLIDFFLAAIIPGLILVILTIVYGIGSTFRQKVPVEKFNLKETGHALRESFFEILLPFLLLVGYFSGLLSLVEVSAVSVIYVFIVEVIIHRDIALKDIPKVLYKAVPIIGGILAILAMAKALSYAVIDSQVPERFALWMQGAVESKYLFLLLLNLALILIGCFMDIISAILVALPLIVPLGHIYGVDPIHLGIIFIINLEAGFLTPPVGMNLFMASYRFNKPFMQICRYVLPFLAIRLVVVLLVTYIPWLSTFLVELFK